MFGRPCHVGHDPVVHPNPYKYNLIRSLKKILATSLHFFPLHSIFKLRSDTLRPSSVWKAADPSYRSHDLWTRTSFQLNPRRRWSSTLRSSAHGRRTSGRCQALSIKNQLHLPNGARTPCEVRCHYLVGGGAVNLTSACHSGGAVAPLTHAVESPHLPPVDKYVMAQCAHRVRQRAWEAVSRLASDVIEVESYTSANDVCGR